MQIDFKCKLTYDFDSSFNRFIRLKAKYKIQGKLFYTELNSNIFYASDWAVEDLDDGTTFEDYVDHYYEEITTVEGRERIMRRIIEKITEEIKAKHQDELDYRNIHDKAKIMRELTNKSNSVFSGKFEI